MNENNNRGDANDDKQGVLTEVTMCWALLLAYLNGLSH